MDNIFEKISLTLILLKIFDIWAQEGDKNGGDNQWGEIIGNPFLGRVIFFGKLGRVVCLHTQRNCSILHSYEESYNIVLCTYVGN